jgi:hypothetical protein
MCAALSLFRYFVFVAAYLETAVPLQMETEVASSQLHLKCVQTSFFRRTQKLIRGKFVYLNYKPVC